MTADGGISWTNLTWNPPDFSDGYFLYSAALNDITCTTTDDCVAVGLAAFYGIPLAPAPPNYEEQGVVASTNDGGQTWQTQLGAVGVQTDNQISLDDLTGLSCPTTRDCVAFWTGSAAQIVTTDAGANWTVSPLASGSQIARGNAPGVQAVSCSTTLECIAVGVASGPDRYATPVIATSDGGATWSSQATNPDNATLQAVACVKASACWAVGSTTSGAVIFHTVNGGAASPMVTGVSPDQGPGAGGTQVSVTGAGFKGGVLSVHFGPVVASDVTVVSDSELTVTVPPNVSVVPSPATMVDVTVTTPLGTSPANPGDQFTYLSSISTSGITLSLTTTAAGALCNNSDPELPVCTGLARGDVVTFSGTGFSPGAIAWIAQCNSEPTQPVISFLGQYIPVSCSRLALTTIPISGQDKGDLSGTHAIAVGTVGPPGTGIPSTCTEGDTTIPDCATSGNAVTDATAYPCPPTPAQEAAGDTCVLAVSDTAGDHAFGILLSGVEPSPSS